MPEFLDLLLDFFERGGPVLLAILVVSVFMWMLIIERYWFILYDYPEQLDKIARYWQDRKDQSSWYALRIREGLITDISIALKKNLIPIQALTRLLPLLGLLGTVTGMIAIFEVLNVFGTGNARGMADGISRALLPTTAGLATSLFGIYFHADLNNRARESAEKARDLLIHQ